MLPFRTDPPPASPADPLPGAASPGMPLPGLPETGRDTVSALIIAAILAIILLLGALLIVLQRSERDELQESLIKDILWVEQTLQFHLVTDEEKLQQAAAGLGQALSRDARGRPADLAVIESQLRQIMAGNPEVERLVWHDAAGHLRLVLPPLQDQATPSGLPGPGALEPGPEDYSYAAASGKPRYGLPERGPDGVRIPLHVPVFDDRGLRGLLTAGISLDTLLSHQVPWWVAENYQLTITDAAGNLLAARSHVTARPDGPSHMVDFDPPGRGLLLSAVGYRSQTHLARNLIVAVILVLAVAVIGSLVALRRQARRRRAFEQALRSETAFRRAMEDSAIVGLRARTLDGRVLYVNKAFCDMVGYPADAIIGRKPPMPYWIPEESDTTMRMHQAAITGAAPSQGYELRWRRSDGQVIEVLTYEAPLIDADGRQAGWMGSVLDITDRKRTEEQARQQQDKLQQTARLIAMGEMASTLAHELNQPLAAIASYAAGCLNRATGEATPDAEMVSALQRLGQQAQRAGVIIRRVHEFVRKSDPVLQPCRIAEVLRDSVEFIAADARKRGIRLQLDIGDDAALVTADRILIEQVMLNLMRNGIEAMSQIEVAGRELTVTLQHRGAEVVITVGDRGPGVAPDIRERLFTAFVTTKAEGMGMGLNICRTIVELHRGRLWHEADPQGGSRFCFTLPLQLDMAL